MRPFKRIGCIVNPVAGGRNSISSAVRRCLSLLRENFTDLFINYTEFKGAEINCTQSLLDKGVDCVVIFGGDGSLHHTLNAFMRQSPDKIPPLTVFPSGSGNDFARMLGLPKRPEDFLAMMLSQKVKKVDIGEITLKEAGKKHWFINCVGMGLDVEVVRQVNAIENHSSLSYIKSIGKAFKHYNFPQLNVNIYPSSPLRGTKSTSDRSVLKSSFEPQCSTSTLAAPSTFAMICNGAYAGSAMHFAPMAEVDDGKFDLIYVKKAWKSVILAHLPFLYAGKHLISPLVSHHKGKIFSFNNPELDMQADGEIIGKADCEVEVKKGRLNIISS